MGVPDLAFDFSLRNKSSYGVDNNNVDRTRTSQNIYDLKSLFTSIWLRAKKVIDIHAKFGGIDWIEGVLSIDECTGQTLTLSFGNYGKGQCGFTRRLRAVDLNDTTTWQTTHAQSDVQAKRTGRNNIDVHCTVGAEPHNGTLAKLFLDLRKSHFQRFVFCLIHSHRPLKLGLIEYC